MDRDCPERTRRREACGRCQIGKVHNCSAHFAPQGPRTRRVTLPHGALAECREERPLLLMHLRLYHYLPTMAGTTATSAPRPIPATDVVISQARRSMAAPVVVTSNSPRQ